MKNQTYFPIILTLILLGSFQSNAQIKKLKVERNHSSINFTIPIAGITAVKGMFTDFSINMDIEDEDFTTSKINATIQAKSINTGIDSRDEHLRTADFFDVEKYPEIIFKSEKITKLEDKQFVATGIVTMHGISKSIDIPFTFNGELGKNTLGFSAQFSLNRLDFEIAKDFIHDSIPNFLSDTITVEINFWTKKRKEKKKGD